MTTLQAEANKKLHELVRYNAIYPQYHDIRLLCLKDQLTPAEQAQLEYFLAADSETLFNTVFWQEQILPARQNAEIIRISRHPGYRLRNKRVRV